MEKLYLGVAREIITPEVIRDVFGADVRIVEINGQPIILNNF